MIIQLKKRQTSAIDYFSNLFAPLNLEDTVILAVPSSVPKIQSGIRMLAKQIANSFNCRVLSGLLQRRYEVAKKSTGGLRDLYSDMDSLKILTI